MGQPRPLFAYFRSFQKQILQKESSVSQMLTLSNFSETDPTHPSNLKNCEE